MEQLQEVDATPVRDLEKRPGLVDSEHQGEMVAGPNRVGVWIIARFFL
jgi:hypothetical protein